MPKTLIKPALIAFLVIYFLYLVLSRVPAEFAASAIHNNAPNFWMTGIQGSIWNGRASSSQIDVAHSSIALGQVRWKLSPWSLLIFSPCVTFEAVNNAQVIRGEACQSLFTGSSLSDVEVEMSIAAIQPLLPMRVAGHASANIIEARLSGGKVKEMNAQLSWLDAQIHDGNSMIHLGSLGLKASPNKRGGIAAKLFEIDGPIGIDILGDWMPGQDNWKLNGTVTLKEGAPDIIGQALPVIGEEKEPDSGVYHIVWPPE